MNTLKFSFIALFGSLLISCNDGAKKGEVETGLEPAPIENDMNSSTQSRADSMAQDDVFVRTQDLTALYSELNMSDDQISRFEDDYRQKLNHRSSDNVEDPNLVDLQMDESLKNVLSPEQYNKYVEWKKTHPETKDAP